MFSPLISNNTVPLVSATVTLNQPTPELFKVPLLSA